MIFFQSHCLFSPKLCFKTNPSAMKREMLPSIVFIYCAFCIEIFGLSTKENGHSPRQMCPGLSVRYHNEPIGNQRTNLFRIHDFICINRLLYDLQDICKIISGLLQKFDSTSECGFVGTS